MGIDGGDIGRVEGQATRIDAVLRLGVLDANGCTEEEHTGSDNAEAGDLANKKRAVGNGFDCVSNRRQEAGGKGFEWVSNRQREAGTDSRGQSRRFVGWGRSKLAGRHESGS